MNKVAKSAVLRLKPQTTN